MIRHFAAALLLLWAWPAAAQPAPDPKLQAAQQVFDGLPEDERRAIQSDLIWTGHYNGTVTGGFGPLTFRAINTFAGKTGAAADGLLTPAQRKALKDGAARARSEAGFEIVTDSRSGIRIGVPLKVLPKAGTAPLGGGRWQSADGKVTLDTRVGQPGETLASLFERATAANPNSPDRKVTYKLLRPDFYVVSGETRTGKFYARMAEGPAGLRGFSVGYDKAMAERIDRLVIAVAAAFEPFPAPGSPAPVAGPERSVDSPVQSPVRSVTAVRLAAGRAVTSRAALDACPGPRIAGSPVQVTAGAGALVTLDIAGGGMPAPVRTDAPAEGEDLVVLSHAAEGLVAMPARAGSIGGAPAIMAPLQPGAAGSPVFDRSGRLALIVTADPARTFMVAGILPERAHAAARVEGGAAPAGPPLSTGAIVAARQGALVRIECGR